MMVGNTESCLFFVEIAFLCLFTLLLTVPGRYASSCSFRSWSPRVPLASRFRAFRFAAALGVFMSSVAALFAFFLESLYPSSWWLLKCWFTPPPPAAPLLYSFITWISCFWVVKGSSLTDLGLRAISPRFSDRQLMCTCSDKTLLIYFTIFDKIVFLMPTLSKGPAFGCLKKSCIYLLLWLSRVWANSWCSFFLFFSIVPMFQLQVWFVKVGIMRHMRKWGYSLDLWLDWKC